jgi:MFS family permease
MILPPALQPLHHPTYRALWFAYVVGSLGSWMQNTGAGWLMTSLAPNPFTVSLVQAATILPVFLLVLPAGALADIVEKRNLLLLTQGWMMLAATLLATLTLAHRIDANTLLALTFAIGIGTAMTGPAWSALVPDVVPHDDLVPAIALNGIGFNLARALGPALAGVLLLFGGAGLAFACYAVSFVGIIGVLLHWHRARHRPRLPPEHMLPAMRAGLRFARNSPEVRRAMLRTVAYYLPCAAPWATLPLLVREQLHLGAGSFGLLLGVMGIGAVACGLLLPRVRRVAGRGRIVAAASLVSCAGIGLLAVSRHFLPAAGGMALFGMGWVAAGATTQAAAQLVSPGWVRARVLALYQLAVNGSLVAGAFFWGWLGTVLGLPLTMACAGALGLVLMVATLGFGLDDIALPAPPQNAVPVSVAEARPPDIARALRRARGRVLETMRYRVDPAEREAFLSVMGEIRHLRGRTGAVIWQLYEDANNPSLWLELWTMEDWTDHLRERSRMSDADRDLLARIQPWREDASAPGRFIAVEPGHRPSKVA